MSIDAMATQNRYRNPGQSTFNFREIVVDNFAGGGGASTGIEAALGRPVDIAINHDPGAIAMHTVNHPHTRHYCESVWDVDPVKACSGSPVGLAWFSPDCKHFSKAKGGKPVEKKIRGLAWIAVKWARLVRPRVIILENVEEFKTWGPLTTADRPCPQRKGQTFLSWVRQLQALGYQVEHRELRACDYGAPTIRKRLFVIARCDGAPIVWPEPTHGPGLKAYRTAAEIIDWSLPCPSIFERTRPLADNTLRRIARGIQRFVIANPSPFIVSYYGAKKGEAFRGQSLKEPLRTQTTENRFALVAPVLTECANASSPRCMPADEPLRTICAATKGGHHALVTAFLAKHYGGVTGVPVDGPTGTVTTVDHHSLVTAHMVRHFGESVGSSAGNPVGTIVAGGMGKTGLITSHLLKLRGTCRDGQSVAEPVPTITAGGTHLGEVRAFLIKYYGQGCGQNLKEPSGTVTTHDRFGLVTVKGQTYSIADIGMRMLAPRELFRAQGFPEDYIIDRDASGKPITKTEQVNRCGNSVPPAFSEALVRANVVDSPMVAVA
jgi:DNA (cytosine-5)-methyltransferase 1